MQCEDAPCLTACEQDAISRGADNIVRIDETRCDNDVAPRAMEKKIPKGHNHTPFSYEIDTWSELRSQFAGGPVKKG